MTRIRKSLVAGVLVLATVGILFLIPAPEWVRRYGGSAKSQAKLRQFHERVFLKAAAQDGRLGSSLEEWIREGLISREDIFFKHGRSDIDLQVLRTLRPIPNTSYPGRLILFVETYDPPQGFVNVLAVNGQSYEIGAENIEELFSSDNALRIEHGLAELEIPRIKRD